MSDADTIRAILARFTDEPESNTTFALPVPRVNLRGLLAENERLRAERDDARHGRELARLDTERERAETGRLRDIELRVRAALTTSSMDEWEEIWDELAKLAAVPEEDE